MKKLFKIISFIILIAVGVAAYNYSTNYSLFDFEDINTPVYQETEESSSDDDVQFEKLYYTQLDEKQRKIYDKVYFAIKEHKDSIRIHSDIGSDDLFDIVGYVLAENPELFWSNGACTYDQIGNLKFEYIYTEDELDVCRQQIEKSTSEIIHQAKAIADEYERALFLFDYIAENTVYDDEAAENLEDNPIASTIAGVFINKKAVCGGYARAYQYLLLQCSLNAETVYGAAKTSDGSVEDHAWTLQQLNGNYYYTDVTWGDSAEEDTDGYISHIYFCLTEEEMKNTHTPESNISYPSCVSERDNYFVREDLYFSSFSKSEIRDALKKQIKDGSYSIEMKFKNEADYKEAVNSLIMKENIYYILLEIDPFAVKIEIDRLSYITEDNKYVLTLLLNKKQTD